MQTKPCHRVFCQVIVTSQTVIVLKLMTALFFQFRMRARRTDARPLPNPTPGYDKNIHDLAGNVAMGDGSVQGFSNSKLGVAIRDVGIETVQLAVPGDEDFRGR